MGKATKAMRTYKVVDREGAKELGADTFSISDYNRFALVAVRGDKLDTVLGWAFKRESLDANAEKRNKDIAMLGKMMGKATDILDAQDESEAD